MHTAGMRLYTAHGTVLYFDEKIGELRHGPLGGSPDNARILLDGSHASALTQTEGTGNRLSLARIASAGLVHAKGLG